MPDTRTALSLRRIADVELEDPLAPGRAKEARALLARERGCQDENGDDDDDEGDFGTEKESGAAEGPATTAKMMMKMTTTTV